MNTRDLAGFWILCAALLLLPIFFIPSGSVSLQASKVILIGLFSVIAFIVWAFRAVRHGALDVPSRSLLLAPLCLVLAYVISLLASPVKALSFAGYVFEPGTLALVLVGCVLFFLVAVEFTSVSRLTKAFQALALGFLLVVVFSLIKFFSHGSFLGSVLSGAAGNPIGSWTDLASYLGLGVLLCAVGLQTLKLGPRGTWTLSGLLVVALFCLAVLGYSTVWIMLGAASLVLLVYSASAKSAEPEASGTSQRKISYLALGLLLVSIFFVWNPTVSSSGSLAATLGRTFNVANTDIRPTLGTTFQVVKPVLASHALLGSGPNSFSADWLMYKPTGVNASSFWNTEFAFGFGFLPSELASVGVLGAAAWLFLFIVFLVSGARALFRPTNSPREKFFVTATFFGALYLWVMLFIAVPSSVMFILTFVLSGLAVAAATTVGSVVPRRFNFARSPLVSFVSVLVLIVLTVGAAAMAFVAYEKVAATVYFDEALVLAQQGASADAVEQKLMAAIAVSPADIYYRGLSNVAATEANTALNATSGTAQANQAAFQTAVQKSVAAAQLAVQANPQDYQNWMTLGSIYEALVPKPLAVQGAYDSAKSAYESALAHNPHAPDVYLALGRLEFENGSTTAAEDDLGKALTEKNDYADAYYLLAQIQINDGDTAHAINSVKSAAILDPQNPGVFFELGVLEYSAGNYADAAAAENQALTLSPTYANAKYYLGLSLAQLGQKDQALAQFRDLLSTNPNEAILSEIISNIESGRDPLYKVGAATTAPVK